MANSATTTARRHRFPVGTLAFALVYFAVLAAMVPLHVFPPYVPLACVGLSAATFFLYASDKRAAEARRWRTPEKTLLFLGLIGGWPGALLAQNVLRHKTQKQPFRALFFITIFLNIAALVALGMFLRPSGTRAWFPAAMTIEESVGRKRAQSGGIVVEVYDPPKSPPPVRKSY